MKPTFIYTLSIIFIFLGCSSSTEMKNDPGSAEVISDAIAMPEWHEDDIDTLSVLSWNVEHFVDDHDNPYISNSREDNPSENMDIRRALVTEALKEANADIVVFQEFESDSYAQQMAEELFPELGYQVFAGHESNDWYMNVVVMSRVPLGIFHSYATTNTPIVGEKNESGDPASQSFTNNRMWTVEVLPNKNYSFYLTGLHLKAGRGERNEGWRRGQMQLLRSHYQQILEQNSEANILTVGDFNSTPDSPEMSYFLGKGSNVEFIDPLAGSGVYSHPADSAFWRIDHILPNTNMTNEVISGSVKVNYFFSADSMDQAADHLPMSIKIIPSDN